MDLESFRETFELVSGHLKLFYPQPHKLVPRQHNDGHITLIYPYSMLERILEMPGKQPKKPRTQFADVKFINYKFSKEEKTAFDVWYRSKDNPSVQALFETLQGENKLGLSWDPSNECFIAAMTGRDDSFNPGKCITVRSPDWMRALAAVAYIHTIIFSGEIWDASSETDMV